MAKTTLNLPDEDIDTLKDLARRHGITMTAALGQAIATQKFIDDEIKADGKVLIEKPDRSLRRSGLSRLGMGVAHGDRTFGRRAPANP